MDTSRLVGWFRTRYGFLRGVGIDIIEDGCGSTNYNDGTKSITMFLCSLKSAHRSGFYRGRLGDVAFRDLVVLVLLHEIRHVWQWQKKGREYMTKRVSSVRMAMDHDSHPLERAADLFAKREYARIKDKIKLYF